MEYMDKRALDGYMRALLKEKERMRRRIDFLEGRDGAGGLRESMSDSIREFSLYDNHPADVGSELFEREKDIRFRDDARVLLRIIDKAIDRVRSGEYGACERCGKDIDEERLRAIPYTSLCSQCQQELEREAPERGGRPVEEEVIGPPFGRHILDGRSPGLDGEDIWQDVARYGTANTPQDVQGAKEYGEVFIGADEVEGAVEKVDLIMAESPDEIPPDPDAQRARP